jgi:hypothetical protein
MSDSELVPAIQADREVAADIWRDYVAKVGECMAENAIRKGGPSDQSMIVQRVARHRIASEAQVKVLREVLERAKAIIDDTPEQNMANVDEALIGVQDAALTELHTLLDTALSNTGEV